MYLLLYYKLEVVDKLYYIWVLFCVCDYDLGVLLDWLNWIVCVVGIGSVVICGCYFGLIVGGFCFFVIN